MGNVNFFNRRLFIAAMFLAVGAPAARAAQDTQVTIDNFAFSPQRLEVKVGTKVTFVNHDDIPHSVVAVGGAFRSPALDTDQSYAFTPRQPGEIAYFCGLHPHMQAKIVVVP